ncbi:MAG: RluA family pseudouridine synthase [bacterium]
MKSEKLKVIYKDKDVLVIDKPAGIVVEELPYLPAHRLDKDTSGVLILAKNQETLEFLQKQFKERTVKKKYLALAVGNLKNQTGSIKTLLGRSPNDRRKQKAFSAADPEAEGKRIAETSYKVLQRFENYDLIELEPTTGRKHQIRAHLAYISHPIAGDKLYGFKNRAFQRKAKVKMKQGFIDNQPCHKQLKRQFLHAEYLRIKLPDGNIKEFGSGLPEDLKEVLEILNVK